MIDDVKGLMKYSSAHKYPKNTPIINENDTMPYSMYILLQGKVRVVKNYGKSNQATIASLNVGDFFGEMSLFLMEPRSATVITAEESILLEINQANVNEFIMESPDILHSIIKTLCTRINGLNEKIRLLAPTRM